MYLSCREAALSKWMQCDAEEFYLHPVQGPKVSLPAVSVAEPMLAAHPEKTEIRQVAYFQGRSEQGKNTFAEKMKRKIDSTAGRALYGMRLAVAEPPFANLRHNIGLSRFSHRGKKKVNTQWNLFCVIHNLLKIHRYSPALS